MEEKTPLNPVALRKAKIIYSLAFLSAVGLIAEIHTMMYKFAVILEAYTPII